MCVALCCVRGQVVTDHALIASTYLRGWFAVDLLGGFPVDACFPTYWLALANIDPMMPDEATYTSGAPTAHTGHALAPLHACTLLTAWRVHCVWCRSATTLLKTAKLSRLFKMLKLVKLGKLLRVFASPLLRP